MPTRLEMLQDHCGAFERALARARTRGEAEALREESCRRLARNCRSEMLVHLLQAHAQARIREHFPDAPPAPAAGARPTHPTSEPA